MKQAISSIHIEKGNITVVGHNDRSIDTINSIFNDEENEYTLPAIEAIRMYDLLLRERINAYTSRTGQKLNNKTITHLSAIVNIKQTTIMEDLSILKYYLEKELGTAVFQIAIHRDEGHIKDGKNIKNYHAHIEMMGIDEKGFSIRRKLTRGMLSNIQDNTATILNMQRGVNYAKEKKKRPKRLGTYEYKEYKRREEITVQAVKQKHSIELNDLKSKLNTIIEQKKSVDTALTTMLPQLELNVKRGIGYSYNQIKDIILEKFHGLKLEISNLKEENKKYAEYTEKVTTAYKNLKQKYSTLEDSVDSSKKQLSMYANQVINLQNKIEVLKSQIDDLEEPDSYYRPSM